MTIDDSPQCIMKKSKPYSPNLVRFSILSNKLTRRLINTNHEKEDKEEQEKIIETLIQQLKSSGYDRKAAREMVVSGVLGWKRKMMRRGKEGTEFYRTAKSTLAGRCKRKLTENSTWFKRKRHYDEDGNKSKDSEQRRDQYKNNPRDKHNNKRRTR